MPPIPPRDLAKKVAFESQKLRHFLPGLLKALPQSRGGDSEPLREREAWAAELQDWTIHFEYFPQELRRIPEKGALVVVANRFFGDWEAALLEKLILRQRPDFRILHLAAPFGEKPPLQGPFLRPEEVQAHLDGGGALGLFPAQAPGLFQWESGAFREAEWDMDLMARLQAWELPVIPAYFKWQNLPLRALLKRLASKSPARLNLAEWWPQPKSAVSLRFGKCIYPKEQKNYSRPEHFRAFLRQRTVLLGMALSPEKKLFPLRRPKRPEAIIPPLDSVLLAKEIELLRQADALLVEQRHYQVFLAPSEAIPQLLSEIGRLREITFRAVGEGTNLPLDLDHYDYHYHHLLLWDRAESKLLGAYRLGFGPEIYRRFGLGGFYVGSLFKLKKAMGPMLAQSLELGRAFVVAEEQAKPLPLFLLWEGIRKVVARRPELRFITGCASISSNYSRFSRSLMVEFLLKNFGDAALAQHLKPCKAFKPKLKAQFRQMVTESSAEDLQKFDRLIADAEPSAMRIPVLIKKYLQQKALMVAFNRDPLFNDSLDGFMYIKTSDLEPKSSG